MGMGKEYIVKILNWRKYQSREVKTKTAWLRLENDFIENPNFADFTSDERIVWLHAMCCASKLNQDHVQVPLQCSHRVLNRCTGIDEKTFHRTFEKLKKLRIVEIRTTRGRYADDTSENAENTQTTHYGDEDVTETETETETRRDADFNPLVEIWIDHHGELPGIRGMSKKRQASAEARWKENPSADYWIEIIQRLARSAFCRGQNDRGWKADFDFLIQPDTQHKVLEGKYDDRPGIRKGMRAVGAFERNEDLNEGVL